MSIKTKKILTFIATLLIVMSCLSVTVFAKIDATGILNEMENNVDVGNAAPLQQLGGNILGILQVAGIIIGAIILTVLGIKYMTGSLEEKAEYKKTMIPYVVGAVIIIAAPTITKGLFSLISNLSATTK